MNAAVPHSGQRSGTCTDFVVLALLDDLEHVRDHFAGALDEHRVANRAISRRSTSSMLCSVERLTVTPPTATGSRIATGVSVPVRPTLKLRSIYHCGFLARGLFVGDGPARRFRRETQLVLQRDFVHLDHDAVNLIRQLFALGFPLVAIFLHRVDASGTLRNRREP